MASGALDPRPLISETIALDAAAPMFARLTMDPGERIKVLVRPGEPPAPVPSR
jgi:threonine dehydrogenase-like Zn-dependent dehydrogenase